MEETLEIFQISSWKIVSSTRENGSTTISRIIIFEIRVYFFLRFESLRNREKFKINFWKKFFLDEIKLNIEKFIPFPCSMLFQDGIIKSLEQLSYTTNNHIWKKIILIFPRI